jgi:hypothetical protein
MDALPLNIAEKTGSEAGTTTVALGHNYNSRGTMPPTWNWLAAYPGISSVM